MGNSKSLSDRTGRTHGRVLFELGKPGCGCRVVGAPVEVSETEIQVAEAAANGDQADVIGCGAQVRRLDFDLVQGGLYLGDLGVYPRGPRWSRIAPAVRRPAGRPLMPGV